MAGHRAVGPPLVGSCSLVRDRSVLYEWSHADVVAGDAPAMQAKSGLAEPRFFVARAPGLPLCDLDCFLVPSAHDPSSRKTMAGGLRRTGQSTALSAGFMAVFTVTFSLASFDWMMSMEPHWFSTMYAGLSLLRRCSQRPGGDHHRR